MSCGNSPTTRKKVEHDFGDIQELESRIQEKNDKREILTNFINKLEDLTGKQTEFREELWGGLVDHIRIDENSSTVVFRGGIEITISYVETRFERASGSFAGCPTFCGFITKWWICQVEYDIIFEAKIREKCERGRNVPSKPH